MANEKQHLVDIDACGRYIAGRIGFRAATVEDVMAYMADFADKHTVDAVEVVRCRDCERWKEPWLEGVTSGKCMLGKTMITETDHFCSYGERKINK